MARASEKHHWDTFWASTRELGDVYANDDRIVEFLAQRVNLDGLRILEVGAGTGRDSAHLASRGAEVWTLDYASESLRLMRENLGDEVVIVCGDALALPIDSESFDLVFHQGLLEHFRDPLALLRENYRILRPGGRVLVDVPQRFHYYTMAKHMLMFVDRWFAGWETEFSYRELYALLADAGFDVEGAYGRNLFPPVWYRGLRKVALRGGLRLPMEPVRYRTFRSVREAFYRAVPLGVRLSTSMVIGCLGRKR